jgi:Zn-finger nucleic acid-binding protein
MADRQGIEIDYCPNCRGVWLDRGELDKIIERSAAYTTKDEPQPPSQPYYDNPKGGYNQPHYNDPRYHHKKKKGFLSDFFDFD